MHFYRVIIHCGNLTLTLKMIHQKLSHYIPSRSHGDDHYLTEMGRFSTAPGKTD